MRTRIVQALLITSLSYSLSSRWKLVRDRNALDRFDSEIIELIATGTTFDRITVETKDGYLAKSAPLEFAFSRDRSIDRSWPFSEANYFVETFATKDKYDGSKR